MQLENHLYSRKNTCNNSPFGWVTDKKTLLIWINCLFLYSNALHFSHSLGSWCYILQGIFTFAWLSIIGLINANNYQLKKWYHMKGLMKKVAHDDVCILCTEENYIPLFCVIFWPILTQLNCLYNYSVSWMDDKKIFSIVSNLDIRRRCQSCDLTVSHVWEL